ncbi:prolyl oligopeptidase family serine peptidase [Histomonas meleagridis]|uniref:prolyl oligopeptidase family serine peptidase n=1 Tax=Histomonas meleagridis TaxID=135588 RepID=UPI003559FE49|nr:prolyl oligopeptidase family serine peptidase [Histomonas meleagridis]KAH0803919.1 prolyl oligopeptidase family serine peptidase [Histomonas meleagridis]
MKENIGLDRNDSNAYTFTEVRGEGKTILKTITSVKIDKDFECESGNKISKTNNFYHSENKVNLVVNDFEQFVFENQDGRKLTYNLFTPKNVTTTKKYPLVMFIHDAGNVGESYYITLIQGIGATVWASEEEQQKRECYVLAPQFNTVMMTMKH